METEDKLIRFWTRYRVTALVETKTSVGGPAGKLVV